MSLETYLLETDEQKKKYTELLDRLDDLSFPFLTGMKIITQQGNSLQVMSNNHSECTIEQFIQKQKEASQVIDEHLLLDFAIHGALTLTFLHKNKIIHGQISPQNVFITQDNILRMGHVDLMVNLHLQEQKESSQEELKKLQTMDMYNFGEVLYVLAELNLFANDISLKNRSNDPKLANPIIFTRLQNPTMKQLILTLLTQLIEKIPNLTEFLAKNEIQNQLKTQNQSSDLPQSSFNTNTQQFSKYQIYLAQILVDIAGSSVDEKLIIAQRGVFDQIVNILKWAKEQNKELVRPLQEYICQIVQTLIDENKPAVEIAFQTEILFELQILLDSVLSLEEVKFIHVDSLKQFTTFGTTNEQRKIMYDMGIALTFLKTMKSLNSRVVEKSAVAIVNIVIYDEDIMDKIESHHNYLECEQNGIIASLYYDGIINGKSDRAKSICAYGLGWLFKTKQIPIEMKSDVVKELKVGMKNEV